MSKESKNKARGYFGIGVYESKNTLNIGTLWRSAALLGADFIFTIGQRYRNQPTDTMKAVRHIPLFQYKYFNDFKSSLPDNCEMVFVEQVSNSKLLDTFNHPERAVYILGAEDDGIPEDLMRGHQKVYIDTERSLNVAVAGSIVMYGRSLTHSMRQS